MSFISSASRTASSRSSRRVKASMRLQLMGSRVKANNIFRSPAPIVFEELSMSANCRCRQSFQSRPTSATNSKVQRTSPELCEQHLCNNSAAGLERLPSCFASQLHRQEPYQFCAEPRALLPAPHPVIGNGQAQPVSLLSELHLDQARSLPRERVLQCIGHEFIDQSNG